MLQIVILVLLAVLLLSGNNSNEGFFFNPFHGLTTADLFKGGKYKLNPKKDYTQVSRGSYTYGHCKGNCERLSPVYQRQDDLYPCLRCSNCGICEYSNGAMQCRPGTVNGPYQGASDCNCWYHGSESGCWPRGKPVTQTWGGWGSGGWGGWRRPRTHTGHRRRIYTTPNYGTHRTRSYVNRLY